ncbi:hypothetical protein BpHYR1_041238 [Brachionus plicatilis]|uniref:Uncharacterized protein n=1 Tax=Brachionus plicatilis TaxID=10195 RepID=A0A3M7PLK9_BRAPC|nr:hypothetical protein BpHYR1_041238 [Brachionus plicatilis]
MHSHIEKMWKIFLLLKESIVSTILWHTVLITIWDYSKLKTLKGDVDKKKIDLKIGSTTNNKSLVIAGISIPVSVMSKHHVFNDVI